MKRRKKKGRVRDFESKNGSVQVDESSERAKVPIRKKKKFRFNRVRAMVTVIVVILVAVVGVSLKNVISLHIEQNQLEDENEQLKSDKSSLTDELKNVNDKSYIEEQARIQLRLIKPGEILYILDGDSEDKSSDKSSDDSDDSKEDNGEASN